MDNKSDDVNNLVTFCHLPIYKNLPNTPKIASGNAQNHIFSSCLWISPCYTYGLTLKKKNE